MTELPFIHSIRKRLNSFLSKKIRSFSGLFGSSFSIFIHELYINSNKPVVLISADQEKLNFVAEDLAAITEDDFIYFPKLESVPFELKVVHPEKNSQYQRNLIRLADNPRKIILIPLQVAILKTLDRSQLKNEYFEIKKSEEIDRESLIEFLNEFGYSRADAVEEIGDYAIRGAIVDIFPFQEDHPIRLEFFGDEVVSIRTFDILSQRSIDELDFFRFSSPFNQMDSHRQTSLLSYLDPDSLIILDQPDLLKSEFHFWFEELSEMEEQDASVYLDQNEFFNEVSHYTFREYKSGGINQDQHLYFPFNQPEKFHGSIKLFLNFLKKSNDQGRLNSVYVLCENEKRKESLLRIIEDELGDEFIPHIVTEFLTTGFQSSEDYTVYLTEHEIFNRIRSSRFRKRPVSSGSILRKMNKLTPGDLVVHVDYGIGIYEGVEKISIGGSPPKDAILLRYRDDDKLYVSLDKINKIQKYTASKDDHLPELTKLGSPEWLRVKKKTQKEIEKMAADLIQIYALRMTRKGFAFSEDTVWQRELETLFPYEETPDQLRAIEEVKQDMQSDKPMDRLLCGDVGFGKTEVAIRAAFKAVQDGKQVAVLVPTTLLANQHYHTFQERMNNFPVNVEMLSRFRSAKQQKTILENLENGKIDIIIGTHRLLSDDVRFKDLGLLIIDEEQRFGVKHKEKIKKFKATIDVLTMSATPIPRTLHMALVGARDMSQIETPPRNRLPISTEICTWDDRLIRNAILKELKRDGQVFFVHNRIETIYGVLERLKSIVPEARFVVAHGQMKESELEKIMDGFYHHQYDVLVATMIIENGIDIPSCNTIFINDAHRFGLAQLYQLRGRVGRSEQQAYAYLIVPSLYKLKKDALKRLFALQEYTELGSGIKIAMKDLEIRGAGNLLGAKQSGHINAVGYELYVKILNEAVEKIKQSKYTDIQFETVQDSKIECTVDIAAEIYFPDDYIGSQSEKAFLYYQLGQIGSFDALEDFVEELKDRFGSLPEPANNLIFMHYLRILGEQNYIQRIQLTDKKIIFTFHQKFLDNKTTFDTFVKTVTTMEGIQAQFKQDKALKLIIQSKMGSLINDNFERTKKLLQEIMNLHYIK